MGSFLSEQEKGNGDIKTKLFFNFIIGVESLLGIHPKKERKQKMSYLTITDWAALVLRLNGPGTGQYRTDDWVTDHSSFLQKKTRKDTRRRNKFISLLLFIYFKISVPKHASFGVCCLYLAAARETLVVVGRPAGAVSVMLVLKEAGKGVFLQLLWVLHKEVIKLSLLHLPPGPKVTSIWHVDLE